jgi:hypothetical protein
MQDQAFHDMCERVKGTNINEQTLLATDYLNHFNEIVMLLDMVPDMPDCLDEVRAWQPKSYPDHFRDSTFSERDLAIAAYELVPPRYREPFEKTVDQINQLIAASTDRLVEAVGSGDDERVRLVAGDATHAIHRLIDYASAIIHGSDGTMDQSEIDALIAN